MVICSQQRLLCSVVMDSIILKPSLKALVQAVAITSLVAGLLRSAWVQILAPVSELNQRELADPYLRP